MKQLNKTLSYVVDDDICRRLDGVVMCDRDNIGRSTLKMCIDERIMDDRRARRHLGSQYGCVRTRKSGAISMLNDIKKLGGNYYLKGS